MASRIFNSSLTVDELISRLKEFSKAGYGKTPVVLTSDYGDHSHTEQMGHVKSVVVGVPRETGYSSSGFAFDEDAHYSEDEVKGNCDDVVVILRGMA